MVEIGIWGEENIKIFSKKMKFIIWKLLRNNYSFLNIFLYIINITYIDINNKLKIKLKSSIKQNDDLKIKLNVEMKTK